MELLTDPDAWISFITLSVLEIVLGIDNIVFITILTGRLPEGQRRRGQLVGLGLAMAMRILLLLAIGWLLGLTETLFVVYGTEITGSGIILILGGLFLLAKSTWEIHGNLEGEHHGDASMKMASFGSVIAQIVLIDIVFSLDSVITAVGLATHIPVMIAAIIVAVLVMMALAGPISAFVQRHPTVKILALAFLILIGVSLIAEGLHFEIPKGYIYFAMAFSVGVEMLNIRLRANRAVELHQPKLEDA